MKPFGSVIALAASMPESPAWTIGSIGGISVMSAAVSSFGKYGLASWKRKRSKLMCAHGFSLR